MFSLVKPERSTIESFLRNLGTQNLSYPDVGLTRQAEYPNGYTVDHNRISLGEGQDTWAHAKAAVKNWRMFDFPWVELYQSDTPIRENENVVILINHYGFWSLNGARIVYTIDEPNRFGFAYGTLADHGETGEERFMVEKDEINEVWYDLFAFSKPRHFLAQLGFPLTRILQKQFAADSKAAMLKAVQSGGQIK